MLKRNLTLVYVYTKIPTKVDGETTIQWKYKNKYYMNSQQDINELDKSESGVVDFDKLKLRTNDSLDIAKTDGISFTELTINAEKLVIDDMTPEYEVESMNTIGNSHLYNCSTYNG